MAPPAPALTLLPSARDDDEPLETPRPLAWPRASITRIAARRKKSIVFLAPDEIWAFEAAARLTYVHSTHGKFDIDLSLSAITSSLPLFIPVHRSWVVNVAHVRELERTGGATTIVLGAHVGAEPIGLRVPVSRDRAQAVRDLLLTNATGLRRA